DHTGGHRGSDGRDRILARRHAHRARAESPARQRLGARLRQAPGRPRSPEGPRPMTADHDDIWDSLWHNAAWAAYLDQAAEERGYRFRAECERDVAELRRLLGARLERIIVTSEPPFPDVEVELATGLSLEELRDAMRRIVDGHVMVQTVARSEEYTGERDYDL